MGKSVKGTKTEQNLLKSFAGESQARNRYTYFAGAARKEPVLKSIMPVMSSSTPLPPGSAGKSNVRVNALRR